MEQERRLRELEGLRDRVSVLEAEINATTPHSTNWPPRQFYLLYYAITGFALGGIGAMDNAGCATVRKIHTVFATYDHAEQGTCTRT